MVELEGAPNGDRLKAAMLDLAQALAGLFLLLNLLLQGLMWVQRDAMRCRMSDGLMA